jgi:hypothetical protein
VSTFAFVDPTIWVGGMDATGYLTQVSLSISVAELDSTVFGLAGFRSRKGGLRTVESQYSGFWEAGTGAPDPEIFTNLGVADRVATIAPSSTETSVAYMHQLGKFAYNPFGQIGELTPFSLNGSNTSAAGVVRGQVAKAKGNVSSTGATGSPVQLGASGSTQYLYAALHVFSAGTTITVQVQSDNASNFPSPTTQGTFSGITTASGTWLTRIAGPITDDWFRLNISAITGTFQIAGAIAIGS